jgi:hypothetical protein
MILKAGRGWAWPARCGLCPLLADEPFQLVDRIDLSRLASLVRGRRRNPPLPPFSFRYRGQCASWRSGQPPSRRLANISSRRQTWPSAASSEPRSRRRDRVRGRACQPLLQSSLSSRVARRNQDRICSRATIAVNRCIIPGHAQPVFCDGTFRRAAGSDEPSSIKASGGVLRFGDARRRLSPSSRGARKPLYQEDWKRFLAPNLPAGQHITATMSERWTDRTFFARYRTGSGRLATHRRWSISSTGPIAKRRSP